MKKLGIFLLAMMLLFGFCGCFYRDPVLESLPNYTEKEFYTSGGFQDFTDYAKYTYDSVTVENLKFSKYFAVASSEDVEEILVHIDNFEQWVDTIGGELKENYDFDSAVVTEGDFFCIQTKAGKPIGNGTYGKFDSYTVYYFDLDNQVLYYFHNNI